MTKGQRHMYSHVYNAKFAKNYISLCGVDSKYYVCTNILQENLILSPPLVMTRTTALMLLTDKKIQKYNKKKRHVKPCWRQF